MHTVTSILHFRVELVHQGAEPEHDRHTHDGEEETDRRRVCVFRIAVHLIEDEKVDRRRMERAVGEQQDGPA